MCSRSTCRLKGDMCKPALRAGRYTNNCISAPGAGGPRRPGGPTGLQGPRPGGMGPRPGDQTWAQGPGLGRVLAPKPGYWS